MIYNNLVLSLSLAASIKFTDVGVDFQEVPSWIVEDEANIWKLVKLI